jgi:hypothetical protein
MFENNSSNVPLFNNSIKKVASRANLIMPFNFKRYDIKLFCKSSCLNVQIATTVGAS